MAIRASFALVVLATSVAAQVEKGAPPSYSNALTVMDALAKGDPPTLAQKFAESETCTVNFLAAKGEVKAHYHAKHEETVVVLRGSGTFRIGKDVHSVKTGDVMHIPRNNVHSFTPTTDDVVVVSVFSPKFDGTDRVFVGG
jgi:quercetin dioxygenase-like cupin family protein